MSTNQEWNVPVAELPKIGEVWGIEGYGLEGHPPEEWGLFVCFNIDGTLRAFGYAIHTEPTDEVRAKAVDKCLTSLENTWLCTAPDIFEPGDVRNVGLWVGGSRFLMSPKVTP